MNKGILISCVFAAFALVSGEIMAGENTGQKFPILADGVMKFDPRNEADQEQLRMILGEGRYHAMMKEAQKDKGAPGYVDAKNAIGQSTAGGTSTPRHGAHVMSCILRGEESNFSVFRKKCSATSVS